MERREQEVWGRLALWRLSRQRPRVYRELLAQVGALELTLRPGVILKEDLAWTDDDHRAVDAEVERLESPELSILFHDDPNFPELLKQDEEAPPILYVRGCLAKVARRVAVVGSRRVDHYGRVETERLVGEMLPLGVEVVSGGARGVDSVAHRAALKGGGTTVVVLGSGLDRLYPSENRKLFDEVAQQGAVVSQFPLRAEPLAGHFPRRNRTIAALAQAVLVTRARCKSGSLITARLAGEMARPVMALPGPAADPLSEGPHWLIRSSRARLVTEGHHVASDLGWEGLFESPRTRKRAPLTGPARMVVRVLSRDRAHPLHKDELGRALSLPPASLAPLLLQLELEGIILNVGGGCYGLPSKPAAGS